MRYHGFDIEPVYLPGADFTVRKDGSIRDRKPQRWNISHFTLTQVDGSWSHANCESISHAKQLIDHLHKKLGTKNFKMV
jgi:hypothetical protein